MASSPEIYLISSILRDHDFMTGVANGIADDMFHVCLEEWKWLCDYNSRYQKTPSKVAFRRHFPDFVVKAVNDTPHFVDEVRKSHARFMLTSTMRDCTDLIADGDVDKAIVQMKKSMIEVSTSIGGVQDTDILTNWRTTYNDVALRVDRYAQFGMSGIPTGFDTLDERTGGVQPGQSWIIGARLGENKSWTILKFACTAILAGYSVHVASLEMSKIEVSMRLHNMLSGSVGQQVFRQLDLSQGKDFDLKAYKEFLRGLKHNIKGQLTVSDARRIGATEIAAQVERHKPDMYLLDYLTLASTRGDGGWQDIGEFSKDLKMIGGNYRVAMVSAAQLNREHGIGKEPAGPEALAGADAIGQDADAVITGKKISETVSKMKLAKYRHGRSGYTWWNHMDLDHGVYKEVSQNDAMKIMDKEQDAADAAAAKW